MTTRKVIDAHLHVWANANEAVHGFPYSQSPPPALQNEASADKLLQQMDENGVAGALIVQPINHKFDHSYVLRAIKEHPTKLKGMYLHDPSDSDAVNRLEELCLQGFVGVRFNPYLWPIIGKDKWERMSIGSGLEVYKRCAELKMPVGIMCFQGLSLHYDDIVELLEQSPETVCVLDHLGFTAMDETESFTQLLSLSKFPSVHVKLSALFRLKDSYPYDVIRQHRFVPLLKTFGSERLLFGSDFPYVLEHPPGYAVNTLVASWISDDRDMVNIMHGTAERLFGKWDSQTGN